MVIFKNIISVFIIVGLVSRFFSFILKTFKMKDKLALCLGDLLTFLIFFPIMTYFVGVDTVAVKYVMSLIAWFIFDLIRVS